MASSQGQRSRVSGSMNPVCRMISFRKRTASKPDSLRPLPWVTEPCNAKLMPYIMREYNTDHCMVLLYRQMAGNHA